MQEAIHENIVDVVPIVQLGSPKRYITHNIPKAYDVDLIVVGATGLGTLQKHLIGSTTDYIVNHAPCNVLVVR